jgi:hypothetical protein
MVREKKNDIKKFPEKDSIKFTEETYLDPEIWIRNKEKC